MTSTQPVTSKICTGCNTDKPLDDYSPAKQGKHGRQAKCKACKAAYALNRLSDPSKRASKQAQERERRDSDTDYRAKRNAQSLGLNLKRYANDAEFRAKALATSKRHAAANPHLVWKKTAIYRLKQFGFTPIVEDFTRGDVVRAYGDECFYCGGGFTELDHFKPISAGGPHTLANVRPCCDGCNSIKRAQDGDTFVTSALDF